MTTREELVRAVDTARAARDAAGADYINAVDVLADYDKENT